MIELMINGSTHQVEAGPTRPLLETLRDELGLRSVREGCGIGVCGACTVLVEGRAISSCLTLTGQGVGKEILTIEGLAPTDELHPVQQAYLDHAAFQCAFCTPGFILTTVAMLGRTPSPDERTIRRHLAGNLCRCGSYGNILRAVMAVSPGASQLGGQDAREK